METPAQPAAVPARAPAEKVDDGPPVVRLAGVSVRFGHQQVLRGIDLDIGRHQTVCVIGESGCGKTVLLKLIVGLLRPT